MSEAAYINLDLVCAQWGQEMAQNSSHELENLLRNALSVLEEQGVYALFLYLHQEEQKMSKDILKKLQEFLQKTPEPQPLLEQPQQPQQRQPQANEENFLRTLRDRLAGDLDKLLLAQDLLRQTLIYALYHVRAKSEVSQA